MAFRDVESRVLGDVVVDEFSPGFGYCREECVVTRVLAATKKLEVGRAMDADAAVAAVQTITMAAASASGTFTLSFRGRTTAPIAWDAALGVIKTAFELISGGVTVTFSATFANATTITFANTVGNIPEITADTRLLLTAGAAEATASIATTTAGELATYKMVAATTANADSILLEEVSLVDLKNADAEALKRAFLVRGPSIVNIDQIFPQIAAGTEADLKTALNALGIQTRKEATIISRGTG